MSTILSAGLVIGANAKSAEKTNPFGLVYDGAITENTAGKVNIHPIIYKLHGLDIAANVYTPANYDATKQYPAVVIAHPNGGVKELFLIPNATHIQTYYVPEYVDAASNKLAGFFGEKL